MTYPERLDMLTVITATQSCITFRRGEGSNTSIPYTVTHLRVSGELKLEEIFRFGKCEPSEMWGLIMIMADCTHHEQL